MTAAFVPPAAELSAATDVTVWGAALPPPVVVVIPSPETEAHPASGLAAGGVVQLEPPTPVPPVPEPPVPEPPAAVPPLPPVLVPPAPVPAAPPLPPVPAA